MAIEFEDDDTHEVRELPKIDDLKNNPAAKLLRRLCGHYKLSSIVMAWLTYKPVDESGSPVENYELLDIIEILILDAQALVKVFSNITTLAKLTSSTSDIENYLHKHDYSRNSGFFKTFMAPDANESDLVLIARLMQTYFSLEIDFNISSKTQAKDVEKLLTIKIINYILLFTISKYIPKAITIERFKPFHTTPDKTNIYTPELIKLKNFES